MSNNLPHREERKSMHEEEVLSPTMDKIEQIREVLHQINSRTALVSKTSETLAKPSVSGLMAAVVPSTPLLEELQDLLMLANSIRDGINI